MIAEPQDHRDSEKFYERYVSARQDAEYLRQKRACEQVTFGRRIRSMTHPVAIWAV